MRAFLLSFAAALCLAPAALAECKGRNLIAQLSPDAQAALRSEAAEYPYASGNYWQATRGDQVITLIGTYHMDDPRHAKTLAALTPALSAASILLVEAGPEEEAALKSHMAAHPEILVNTDGPTLPEVLSPADWEQLSQAMTARGIPAFMAAKFRPWYISVMLGIPPCAVEDATTARGLDGMLQDAAAARHVIQPDLAGAE